MSHTPVAMVTRCLWFMREFGLCMMSEIVLFALYCHRVSVDLCVSNVAARDVMGMWPVDLFFCCSVTVLLF